MSATPPSKKNDYLTVYVKTSSGWPFDPITAVFKCYFTMISQEFIYQLFRQWKIDPYRFQEVELSYNGKAVSPYSYLGVFPNPRCFILRLKSERGWLERLERWWHNQK